MGRWLRLAVAGLALLWAPFLYKELTRELPATETDALRVAPDRDDDLGADEPVRIALPAPVPDEPTEPATEQPHSETEAQAPPEPEAEPAAAPAAPPEAPVAATAEAVEAPEPERPEQEEEEAAPASPPAGPTGPLALLKENFDSETRDALWASDQETKLAAFMTEAGFEAEALGDVKCMRTVCRLSLTIAAEGLPTMAAAFGSLQSQRGAGVAVEPQANPGDDTTEFMVYIARKGYSLADLAKK